MKTEEEEEKKKNEYHCQYYTSSFIPISIMLFQILFSFHKLEVYHCQKENCFICKIFAYL